MSYTCIIVHKKPALSLITGFEPKKCYTSIIFHKHYPLSRRWPLDNNLLQDITCGLNSKDLASLMKDHFGTQMAMSMDQVRVSCGF